jgi:hypothetical protein
MPLPESQSKVLEEGTEALLAQGEEAEVVDAAEGEEFADLNSLTPEAAPAAAPAKKPAAAPVAAAPAPEDDDLPPELKGKSQKELAKMYREAQSVIGRQGSELGELRKRTDFAIQTSLEAIKARRAEQAAPAAPAAPKPELDESEFFVKPKATVDRMIEEHPIIKEIRATLGKSAADVASARATAATERFNQAHPDASEILADPEFRQWVNASRVRTGLMHQAHQKFNFDAGDEVFSTWKALKGVKTTNVQAAAAAAEAAAPASSSPTEAEVKAAASVMARAKGAKQAAQAAAASAAAAPTGGASAAKSGEGKKIFRRADIRRLMEEEPDRYEQLADEISLAYSENRVR